MVDAVFRDGGRNVSRLRGKVCVGLATENRYAAAAALETYQGAPKEMTDRMPGITEN